MFGNSGYIRLRPLIEVIILLAIAIPTLIWIWPEKEPGFDVSQITPEKIENLVEARFYQKLANNNVRCQLCFKRCFIEEGAVGPCRVRKNIGGRLYTLVYGQPSAVHIDPIEKEPLHHFLPGSQILCVGTVGCNFRCKFCHNWHLAMASPGDLPIYNLPPERLVQEALKRGIGISFTYNEPTVLYEYMYDTAKLAREKGVPVIFHTNGGINPEPLRALLQHMSAVTVDLKAFTAAEDYKGIPFYRLEPVLNTLKIIREEGVWLEIVNLVIPGLNDDKEQIKEMCVWIKENLGPDVPVHFSRFFPAYKLTRLPPTPIKTLEQARDICVGVGINYVTIGNVPGHKHNSTFCPQCGKTLIKRTHFAVLENNIQQGRCPVCGREIPGVWQW